MKKTKKDDLPLYSENEFQRLLKEVENGSSDARKKIINNLSSIIYDTLNNFKNSRYEYDVLFLFGLRGANNAIDYYDKSKNPEFIPWVKNSIFLSVDYHLKNHPYPAITKDYLPVINNILSIFKITDSQMAKLLSAEIKFYLENMKSSTYRYVILKYYTPNSNIAKVAKGFNMSEEQAQKIINIFNDMVNSKIVALQKSLPAETEKPVKKEETPKTEPFYVRIKNYVKDETEMWEIFNGLSEKHQQLLKFAYGPNLDEIHEEEVQRNYKNIQNIINRKFKPRKNNGESKTFYERIKRFIDDEDEMWQLFDELPARYQRILETVYGPNLDETNEKEMQKNYNILYEIILQGFKIKHDNKTKAFYERVKSYVKDETEMWEIFNDLPQDYQQILISAYGPNLNEIHEEELLKNYNTINNIIQKIYMAKHQKIQTKLFYNKVKPYVKDEDEMWEIFNNLPSNHQQILISAFGPNLDEIHVNEIRKNAGAINSIIYSKFNLRIKNKKIKSFYERVKSYVKSEEKMWEIFNDLPLNEQQILVSAYGSNLDEPRKEELQKNTDSITAIIQDNFKSKKKKRQLKTFYERVKPFVKDEAEMWEIFNTLSSSYQQILITTFGPNLDEVHEDELKKNVNYINTIIHNKFKLKIKNQKTKTFYERVKDFVLDEVEIWIIFNNLPLDYQRILISAYGPNLDEVHEKEIQENVKVINTIIKNKFKLKQTPRKTKTFYERVKPFVKDETEMWEIFNTLSSNYQQILISTFGPNLDEVHEAETKKNTSYINTIIQNKFKLKKKNRQLKTFYERVKPYVKEEAEMWEIFNKLPPDYQQILIFAYGPNLDEAHEKEIQENAKVIHTIVENKFKLKQTPQKSKTFYERVKPYVKDETEMWEIIKTLSSNYQQILISTFGPNLDEVHEEELKKNANYINTIIHNKFKLKMKSKKLKTFYERVKPFVKDEAEMWEIINTLSSNYQQILISTFGPNLDEVHEEELKKNASYINTIIKNKFKLKQTLRKSKTFYERVKPFVKDETEMWEIFNVLSTNYQQVLISAFGPNLDEVHEEELKENAGHINSIIQNKFKLKTKSKKLKTFYERVKPYVKDETEMWEIFNTLSSSYQQILITTFGPNLDEVHEEELKKNASYINTIIKNKFKLKQTLRKSKTFYERVKPFVKDETEMWEIFNTLSSNYQQILISTFGPNLDEVHEDEIKKNVSYINTIIQNKFKLKKKNRQLKTFCERVKPYVKDEAKMWEIFNNLSQDEQQILVSAYGPNLNEIHREVIKQYNNEIYTIIIKKFKNGLKTKQPKNRKNEINSDAFSSTAEVTQFELSNKIPNQDLIHLLKLFISLSVYSTNEDLEDLLIFALRIDETQKYKIEDICQLFNKTEEEINNIARACLVKYEKIFGELYTGIINILNPKLERPVAKKIVPLEGENNE